MRSATTICVREGRAEDAVAVIEIVRDSITRLCVNDHHNEPHLLRAWLENKTPENYRSWLSDPDNYCLVADVDGICGVGLLHRSGEIRLLYVSPQAQGRGVGRTLLERLEMRAREWGLTQLRLSSTTVARPFYESVGYCDCNESDTWRGIVCYKYEKALLPITGL